jgi:thioredoxin-like negative regulator of GroEL
MLGGKSELRRDELGLIRNFTLDDSYSDLEDISKKGKILVEYYAEWNKACKEGCPELDKFREENKIVLIKVDIDKFPDFLEKFDIKALPYYQCYMEGRWRDEGFYGFKVPQIIATFFPPEIEKSQEKLEAEIKQHS